MRSVGLHVRGVASALVPLLALGCSVRREVRLEPADGPARVFVAEDGGQPIAIPEAELRESFRRAARDVRVKADPLAAAEEAFGLAEGSGTYRYYGRSGLLAPEALHGLEEVEGAAERMTREYRDWCGGDCLHLLGHSKGLTLHGRYVVTVVMALKASFEPMMDSLRELADPNAVATMLGSAVAVYLLLLLVPEPISKLVSLAITGALIGYLGLTMFWELVYGARAMARAVDAATGFGELKAAARDFGKVLGPQIGQLLILLVCHGLGKGLSTAGPPRFAAAAAQAELMVRVPMAAAQSVTVGEGVVTISLATGMMAVGAPTLRNLGRQLAAEEAASAFKPNGELSDEALRERSPIYSPEDLGNPAIPKGFGKYTTRLFKSPSGWFQVHFYYNPSTGEVFYGLDYKVVFQKGIKVYTPDVP